MSEYESVQRGSLKLKGVSDGGVKKKKKKKDKKMKKELEQITGGEKSSQAQIEEDQPVDSRTKAEIAFEEVQQKRSVEKVLKKAQKTHKERIMEFNTHLDNLTEHFDIPKVSWTK